MDAGLGHDVSGASGATADPKVNVRGQGKWKTGQEKLRVESAALSMYLSVKVFFFYYWQNFKKLLHVADIEEMYENCMFLAPCIVI